MSKKPDHWYDQSAVIPYRIKKGKLTILLITSLKKKRWILPKGIIEPGMSPEVSAAKEAQEEAGVTGRVSPQLLGTYQKKKWGKTCSVQVYPLKVIKTLKVWPEQAIRSRKWFKPQTAIGKINNNHLKQIIRNSIQSDVLT